MRRKSNEENKYKTKNNNYNCIDINSSYIINNIYSKYNEK